MKNMKFIVATFFLSSCLIMTGCRNRGGQSSSDSSSSAPLPTREEALNLANSYLSSNNITLTSRGECLEAYTDYSDYRAKSLKRTFTTTAKLNEKKEAYMEAKNPNGTYDFNLEVLEDEAGYALDTKDKAEAYLRDYVFLTPETNVSFVIDQYDYDAHKLEASYRNDAVDVGGYFYRDVDKQFVMYFKGMWSDAYAEYITNKEKELESEHELDVAFGYAEELIEDTLNNGTYNPNENKFSYTPIEKTYEYCIERNFTDDLVVAGVTIDFPSEGHLRISFTGACSFKNVSYTPDCSANVNQTFVLSDKGTTSIVAPTYTLEECDHVGRLHFYEDQGDKCQEYCGSCFQYIGEPADHLYHDEEVVCGHCGHVKNGVEHHFNKFESTIGSKSIALYKSGDNVYYQLYPYYPEDIDFVYPMDASVRNYVNNCDYDDVTHALSAGVSLVYYYEPKVLTYCAIEASTQADGSNIRYNNATITLIKDFELGEYTLNELLSMSIEQILAIDTDASIEDTQNFIEVISFLHYGE